MWAVVKQASALQLPARQLMCDGCKAHYAVCEAHGMGRCTFI
jgi:hypothetical protein